MQNEAQGSKPYVRLATHADALDLAPRLRKEDVEEISHGTGMAPEMSLRYGLGISDIAYAVVWQDRVIALFGIVSDINWDDQTPKGYPWMLAAPELRSIRKSFLRQCRGYVRGWLDRHGLLEGHVWVGNEVHIQWLRWLGFQLDEPAPHGVTKQPFMRFHMQHEGIGGA